MAFSVPLTEPPVLPHEALEKYRHDDAKFKANLTVGTYWNEQEKLHAFETVRVLFFDMNVINSYFY